MSFPDLSTYGGFQGSIGYAGMIANMNPIASENMINESTTAIDFGVAVAAGAVVNNIQLRTCKPIAVDADLPIGLSIRHLAYGGALRTPIGVNGVVGYPQGDAVPVAYEGDFIVIPFENVVAYSQVLSITAQGGKLGSAATAAAGTGRVVVPGATWLLTAVAGQPSILRIVK
jgi:hypothetical protein